ncbi:GNAT family protein [Parvularcula sp. LCG005]|uniref:GNAT family N-acetyltransferase n=1 Tax=Parvularcula sp. LCG005 TaxID=3078805 RepID=UPI00294395DC|nr:GNAT family protein [Parvularcula sp. LCG005]WOI53682.1 GNAT family protein [Parvularcula sp. LCG005]
MARWLSSMSGWGPAGITLVNGAVTLRPPLKTDFEAWQAVMTRDRDVLAPRQPTWPDDHLSLASYRRRLRVYDAEREQSRGFAFHIVATEDDRFLGVLRIAPIHYGAAQSGTLGYWVERESWGQGIATQSVAAAVSFVFKQLQLARLDAHCLPDNIASRRVLEKNGFQEEGTLRSFLEINKVRKDHILYGRVAQSVHGSGGQ